MKNPNRYGTCYKLSGKRRKPYIARAYKGKNEDGSIKYDTIGYFETKTDGMIALAKYHSNPYDLKKSKYTLTDVFNLWKNDYVKYNSNEHTFKNYEKAFKLLKPLHFEEFRNIKGYHWQVLLDELGEKYKKHYLDKVYTLLVLVYKYALNNDICDKDYSKTIRKTGIRKEEQDYFTQIEIARIYKAVGKVKNSDAILTLCLTGLRPAELFNITKFNVDFQRKIIFGVGVKTSSGLKKRVPISKYLFPILKNRYNDTDNYLFHKPGGEKMNYQYFLNHIYKPALNEIGLKYKSPKACRHFLATITNEAKVNKKARTGILGHTKEEFTDDVYTHTEDRFLNEEFQKVDDKLGNIF